MTRLDRLMAEILLLQERRRTGDELAGLLEVSRRTVIRDVQSLCEMGVPVLSSDGPGGGYELGPGYSVQPPALSSREAMLLMLAVSGLGRMSNFPFSEERASLHAKLRAMLSTRQQKLVEEMLARVEIEVPDRPQRTPHLEALFGFVAESRWIAVCYASIEGKRTVVLRPERVFADRGFWYLDAVSSGQRRMYRVDRILSVEPCDPPDNLEEPLPYDHASHPQIVVLLSARGIREVERDPHLGHAVAGRHAPFTLTFRCPPSELGWYARFFGGLGSDAVVEGPPDLVDRIKAWASGVLQVYNS